MNKSIDRISGPEMAEWCDYLADDNAIHLTKEAAEVAGFGPRRVNPGPANLSYLLACLGAENEAGILEIDARFSGNVFEDDDLIATVTADKATLSRDGEVLVSATIKVKS